MTVPPDRVPHNAVSCDSTLLVLPANHIAYLQTFIVQLPIEKPSIYQTLVLVFLDADGGIKSSFSRRAS